MYSCVSEDASGKEADGFGCGNESELAGYGPGFLIHWNQQDYERDGWADSGPSTAWLQSLSILIGKKGKARTK